MTVLSRATTLASTACLPMCRRAWKTKAPAWLPDGSSFGATWLNRGTATVSTVLAPSCHTNTAFPHHKSQHQAWHSLAGPSPAGRNRFSCIHAQHTPGRSRADRGMRSADVSRPASNLSRAAIRPFNTFHRPDRSYGRRQSPRPAVHWRQTPSMPRAEKCAPPAHCAYTPEYAALPLK